MSCTGTISSLNGPGFIVTRPMLSKELSVRKLFLALAFALVGAAPLQARTFVTNERTVYFTGVIGGNAIAKAAAIEALSAASSDPIKFVINSPGGAVLPGLQVISAMRVAKARGVKFECFVPVLAASMAFQLHTATGKLKAEMTATSPNGCHCSYMR